MPTDPDPDRPSTEDRPSGSDRLSSEDRPLGRLSRFDGTKFHPVTAGSVDAPFVHVFVHGWQPGFRLQERLHAVTDVLHTLPAWDPRLTDATGRTLISYYQPLLEALADLGPDHCVLWYSWLDESATDTDLLLAFRSRQATQINGRRLALGLQQATGRPDTRLHLIGHSHGSAVAVHAAVSLGRTPEQITLLDAPESPASRFSGAADLIDAILPRLYPGRENPFPPMGSGTARPFVDSAGSPAQRSTARPFVDSFTSVFGRPYHRKPGLAAVVDVSLTPGLPPMRDPVRAINWAHLYAVDWYARSVREAERGVGYGWSPLRGADVTALQSFYRSAHPQRPLDLRRGQDLPQTPAARRIAAMPTRRSPVADSGLHLDTRTPAAALILRSVPDDFLLEFDLDVQDGDGDEQIQLDVDAVPAFITEARFPVPAAGRYVMLADGRPGEHLLTARLIIPGRPAGRRAGDSAGPPVGRPRVSITNVTVVNWPGAVTGFSFQRTAVALFLAGAATGSVATLLTLITTGWTVRRALRAGRARLRDG